ncbi:MAG: AAA family ATPase [Chloroflexota bacterium]|jgi:MoxR-like ATPase
MAKNNPDTAAELEAEDGTLRAKIDAMKDALGRVIVGQRSVVDETLTALISGGHVLLEGVPGLGKTLLVRTLGQVTGLEFARVQFTPDLMPGDITGTQIFDRETGGLRFAEGPIFTNLLLADEINRATPRTQSALLEAMQEHTVTAGGHSYPLPEPFFVLATQNPLEMEGTYPLPEAQLDRFLFKIMVPFPSDDELSEIAERTTGQGLPDLSPVIEPAELLAAMRLARQVVVAPHVMRFAVRLVGATHPDRTTVQEVQRFVRFGSSPRGLQALVLASKVAALQAGRWNVAFGDLQRMAKAALRHRMILQFEATAEGITPDQLIDRILSTVSPES